MRDLRTAFMDMLPDIPLNTIDRYPSFPMFNMSIKIMIWNVQGAGSQAFLTMLRELIRINKPTILALVETHISGETAQKVCDRIGFSGQFRVDAQGFRGGIWLFWRTDSVAVKVLDSHTQHITVEISKVGERPWVFSAIYASPDCNLRKELWEALEQAKRNFTGPWILGGDFNDTTSMSERVGNGGTEMQRRCRNFANWVESNGLIELQFSGPNHTWSRGDSAATYKAARLDRFLCNDEWRMRFDNAAVRHLPKSNSDHCPIIVSSGGFAPIPASLRPFRFQAAWLSHEKFDEFVTSNWDKSAPIVPFQTEFASKLCNWNRETFHNIFRKKAELWARIEGVQKRLSMKWERKWIKLEAKLRRELDDVLHEEEMIWFQKSRLEAIKDGDRNTKYFHLATVIRRHRNRVDMLQDKTGAWITEPSKLRELVVQYWSDLFTEEEPNFDTNNFSKGSFPLLTSRELEALTRPYAQCEVVLAIKSMQAFKAPGPDGFQPLFYQRYWDVVRESVTKVVLDVVNGKDFPADLNKAFLVLIPKVDCPQQVSQFRPIGLCNIIYKAATKVLVNRLKPILPSLISPTQGSFVPNRQITDNIIIVQEMLHSMRKKQGEVGYMAIKIDFEKAYDRLRWSFI